MNKLWPSSDGLDVRSRRCLVLLPQPCALPTVTSVCKSGLQRGLELTKLDDRVRAISLAMGLIPIMWTATPDGQKFDTNGMGNDTLYAQP